MINLLRCWAYYGTARCIRPAWHRGWHQAPADHSHWSGVHWERGHR